MGDASSLRRDYPAVWLGTLVGPFVVTGLLLALLYVLLGGRFVWRLLATAAATFFFFGRFVILGGSAGGLSLVENQRMFTAEQLFFLVMYMDIMIGVLVVFHSEFLFGLPLVGPKLRALVADGQFILKSHPWMKRATFAGLVAFVMFPLAATGSVGGSIFGRLLGMSRPATLAGVSLGSLLGCGLMYFGAGWISRHVDRNDPVLTVGGIAVVALIILILNYRYQQLKKLGMADGELKK